jgi:ribA/ribD-fused uncharacterized protein
MIYHFFWGGPFSQWARSPFKDCNGLQFSSAEQYMMYRKAMIFEDRETANQILAASNPREQKSLGRKVKNFEPKFWDKHKFDIVLEGNFLKFKNNEHFAKQLLGTQDLILVEASPYDRIWGIGYAEADALANLDNWGKNLLGLALMGVREVL